MRVLTVNAGSTSMKLAEVVGGEVESWPTTLDEALGGQPPDCVAHRVVHGGDRIAPELVDDIALAALRELVAIAPSHQPPALEAIEASRAAWPDVPNVA